MPLWKKLWLLFAVIWLVVSALNAGTILAFSEQREKAVRPIALCLGVPALAYLLAWLWDRRRRPGGGHGDDQLLYLARVGVEAPDAFGELVGRHRLLVVQPAERFRVKRKSPPGSLLRQTWGNFS